MTSSTVLDPAVQNIRRDSRFKSDDVRVRAIYYTYIYYAACSPFGSPRNVATEAVERRTKIKTVP